MARAPLDWRNVGTPDFSPAMQGIQIASNLMARAGESARSAFNDVDKRLLEQQQAEYARRLAGYATSEQAAAAGLSGEAFAGLSRLKPEDIARLASTRNNLQAYEGEGQNQRIRASGEERTTTLFNQGQGDRAARQAAVGVLDQIDQLQRNGKFAEAEALRRESAPILNNLEFNDARTARRDISQAATDFRQGRYSDQAYNIADWNQNRAVENYNDQNSVAQFMVNQVRQGATWEDAEAAALTSGMNPRAVLNALTQARGMFDSVYGDMTAGAGAGGGDIPVTGDTFDAMVGITAQAESGNRERDSRGNLITSPKGAQGRMQVMPGTNLDPGFGVTPARDNSDAERTRVGRDYLRAMNERYKDPAKAWAAYNWGPGNLDQAIQRHGDNWLAHAPAETRNYVRGNMAALSNHQRTMTDVTVRGSQDLANDRVRPYSALLPNAMQSVLSAPQVVSKYAGPKSENPDIDPAGLSRMMDRVQRIAEGEGRRLTPEAAAIVAVQNMRANPRGIRGMVVGALDTLQGNRVGDNWRVNPQSLAADVKHAVSNDFSLSVVANQDRTKAMSDVQTLTPRVEALKQEVVRLRERDARVNGGRLSTGTITRMQVLAQLEQQLMQAQATANEVIQ